MLPLGEDDCYIGKYGDIPIDVPQARYWGCVPGIPGGVGASEKLSV